MALVQIAGLDVVSAQVCRPRVGVWHATAMLDSDAPLALGAAATLALGSASLQGTIVRSGAPYGACSVRVVGGAGGLPQLATPKFYRGVQARAVVTDLLAAAGEKLSPTADAAALGVVLTSWTTVAQPTGAALSSLCMSLGDGVAWRVLEDGSVWIGTETWPDAAGLLVDVLDEHPDEGWRLLAMDDPTLAPGVTLDGRRVDYVEVSVESATVRIKAWEQVTR